MRKFYLLLIIFLFIRCIIFSQKNNTTNPWNIQKLQHAPNYHWLDSINEIRSLLFTGDYFNGHETSVFAYYASPLTINKYKDKSTLFPAIVLCHGGGGMAFKEWVLKWANYGYAAIAVDYGGNGPDSNRLLNAGPYQSPPEIKYNAIGHPFTEHWHYHAVTNTILAHSLIRTFKEIDTNRIAINGISWGGFITHIISGVDHRFKVAVPVYAGAFFNEMPKWIENTAKKMPEEYTQRWLSFYNPCNYLCYSKIPTLFITGTTDFSVPLNVYQKTIELIPEKNRYVAIIPGMQHGHQEGWAPNEIEVFVSSFIKNTLPLSKANKPVISGNTVSCNYFSQTKINNAFLYFTNDTGDNEKRKWNSVPAIIEKNIIVASPIPEKWNTLLFSIEDERHLKTSSEILFK